MNSPLLLSIENVFDTSISFPQNKLVAILGRNGAGKTTLLKKLIGEIPLKTAKIRLGKQQKLLSEISYAELSQTVAFLPQEPITSSDLSLHELLQLAYLPKMGWWGSLPETALPEIDEAISRFHLSPLKDRRLRQMSTGERQRAFLARALLQKTELLFLDEPTNHLDPSGTVAFWELLQSERNVRPFLSLVSTHDLLFARKHCDWILALDKGNLIYSGPAADFWSAKFLEKTYGPLPSWVLSDSEQQT